MKIDEEELRRRVLATPSQQLADENYMNWGGASSSALTEGRIRREMEQELRTRERPGPSMGCALAEPPYCSICEEEVPCGKSGPEHCDPAVPEFSDVRFLQFSLVPAPLCGLCKQSMTYSGHGTNWACQTDDCAEFNVPIVTGIGGVASV